MTAHFASFPTRKMKLQIVVLRVPLRKKTIGREKTTFFEAIGEIALRFARSRFDGSRLALGVDPNATPVV